MIYVQYKNHLRTYPTRDLAENERKDLHVPYVYDSLPLPVTCLTPQNPMIHDGCATVVSCRQIDVDTCQIDAAVP